MNLIIHNNSKIVSSIKKYLIGFDLIDISEINLITNSQNYEYVFIFYWSKFDNARNIELVKKIDPSKIVFVSSTLVFSLLIRKQYDEYPNNKYNIEKMVLQKGGAILRLGIFENTIKYHIIGYYQKTTMEMLVCELNNWTLKKERIVNCYKLQIEKTSNKKEKIFRMVRKGSLIFSRWRFMQNFQKKILTLINVQNYSCYGDSFACCHNVVLIGYGAFGSEFYKKYSSRIDSVIHSEKNNITLTDNGFFNTLIGKSKYGLSELWHKVYIHEVGEKIIKKISNEAGRISLPRDKKIKADVQSIIKDDNLYRCQVAPEEKASTNYFEIAANKIILSAGPFENARLINTIERVNLSFDDHEFALLGEVTLDEIKVKYVKKIGLFLIYKESKIIKCSGSEVLIEFRPYVEAKKKDALTYYQVSKKSIIYKLLTQFDVQRINEAFYNRFNISFATKRILVYGQKLKKECINYSVDKGFQRVRISSHGWSETQSEIGKCFKTFNMYSVEKTIDSMHTWSSCSLNDTVIIGNLIKDGTLKIFGSPNDKVTLSSKHHTIDFRNELLRTFKW